MSANDAAEIDIAVVRQAIAAMSALDIPTVLALLADEFVLELPFRSDGGPRRLHGENALAFVAGLAKLLSELNFTDVVVHGALPSGLIVAEYASNGLTRSGRGYLNRYVAFFAVTHGRIEVWREYFDPTVVAEAFPSR